MLYVSDAINRIELFKQELINAMPAISTQVAGRFLNAKLLQIRKVGIGTYSNNTYSAHFLKGKELNSAGRTFIDGKIKKKEKTNWKQLRQAQGLPVSFVNVYYSGQMLNSTGIERNNSASFRFYSIIGGRNAEAKRKLYLNRLRYGRFLHPTPEQAKVIAKDTLDRVAIIYKRVLLNR